MLGEMMKRDCTVDYNNKTVLENKLNVGEYRIFECRKSRYFL
jgi:hypothetical protein